MQFRKFGQVKPVFRRAQSAWFQKWPWLHKDQAEDRIFCDSCEARNDEKDVTGEKKGGFRTHKRSEVKLFYNKKIFLIAGTQTIS